MKKPKNWDLGLSWVLTGIWVGIPASWFIDLGLGRKMDTFSAVVLCVCLAVNGVLSQLWYRRCRLYKAMARLLAEQCDRLESGD